MRLFLASSFARATRHLFERVGPRLAVAICNAFDPWEGQPRPWVEEDLQALRDGGCEIHEINARVVSVRVLARLLAAPEPPLLFVSGGSALYLLGLLRRRALLDPLRVAVARGSVYVGSSAGSMIAGTDLSLSEWDADEREAKWTGKLRRHDGLGFVPFYLLCHAQDREYRKNNQEIVRHLPEYRHQLLSLRDGQALWVEDGRVQVVGS